MNTNVHNLDIIFAFKLEDTIKGSSAHGFIVQAPFYVGGTIGMRK